MGGQHRQRRVEGIILERQGFGACLHDRRGLGWPLGDHLGGGLDGRHLAVRRLVGAGSGADIENRPGVAQRIVDPRGNSRVAAAVRAVANADAIVGDISHEAHCMRGKVGA
jgi:hypothetical protein